MATMRPLRLQPLDRVDLSVGQHLGDHLVDADRLGNRSRAV